MDPGSGAAALKAGAEIVGAGAAMMGGKRSKWLAHVKKTMKAHKGKSLKQVLKMAKKTYRGGASPLAPAAVGGSRHGATRRGARRA